MKGEEGSLISLLARKRPVVGWTYYVFALSSVTKTLFQFRSELVCMNTLGKVFVAFVSGRNGNEDDLVIGTSTRLRMGMRRAFLIGMSARLGIGMWQVVGMYMSHWNE